MTGAELLAAVPQHLRDIAHPDLLGQSPTQVVADGHVDQDGGCMACKRALEAMGVVCGARWAKYPNRVCGLPAGHDGDHRCCEISFPESEAVQ